MEKIEEYLSQLDKDLGSNITSDPKIIIELSYQHLPYHLKSCFLYFGTFLEGEEINISKLTWLWIGEGFVKNLEGESLQNIAESLQNIAEGCLENLINKYLVMDTKRSSDGKVKSCCMHGPLLDFCKQRSEEEHLLQWIKREDKRIDVSSRQVSQLFHNFKFLKMLDLESIVINYFPTVLVYLRYFAAQTAQDSISLLIANLWNLETLKLKSTKGKLRLPVTVWKMDVELLLLKTPNLRELRCSLVDFRQEIFPKLDSLTWLETLEIHLAANSTIDGPYNFPSSLRNFTLSNFFLGSCHKSNISKLPNLHVLKLVSIFFDNDKWEVRHEEFLKLKVLKLVKCEFFDEWKCPDDDAFPMLAHLVLDECPSLKEIPSYFVDSYSLKSIKVKRCSESVEWSAKKNQTRTGGILWDCRSQGLHPDGEKRQVINQVSEADQGFGNSRCHLVLNNNVYSVR
ncbi:hypothetical protein CQW23_25648 [Capsicum baccatum]|uniref:Disease resistance protein winged helix domain-containing protein n=1 Tax=Capsicum baccatum TaxID=33114 RepID=A0A2G2VLK6_CAPBA|nr:hypothetical protein CQW23_25648 [Capsicum baccatum]